MYIINSTSFFCCFFVLFFCISCNQEAPPLSNLPTPLSAREQYELGLQRSSAQHIKEWEATSNLAFSQNVKIAPPFRQTGFFLENRADVLSYLIDLKKGEQIDIKLKTDIADTQVFMEFFKQKNGTWYPILKNKKQAGNFHFEVTDTETYLLRIQPEFYKKAAYELTIFRNPLYAFPVAGKTNLDVWSFWGDPRGGGKRKHKGIDIFARRGTPLIAVADGFVTNVSDKGLGGKQVWIRDSKNNNSIYYAHLHQQLVEEGQNVQRGDTIGLVGNTGNAKTTRPHLHFGIYLHRKGPVDPLPYVYTYSNQFPRNQAIIKLDHANNGVTTGKANLRIAPGNRNPILAEMEKNNPVELLGAAGQWFHVRTQNGMVGFIHFSSIQQLMVEALS